MLCMVAFSNLPATWCISKVHCYRSVVIYSGIDGEQKVELLDQIILVEKKVFIVIFFLYLCSCLKGLRGLLFTGFVLLYLFMNHTHASHYFSQYSKLI